MALIENRRNHPGYCYICDSIHRGKCNAEPAQTKVDKEYCECKRSTMLKFIDDVGFVCSDCNKKADFNKTIETKVDSVEITDDQVAYAKELAESTRQRWKDHADSVGKTGRQIMLETMPHDNEYAKEIWNAAIEAAAEKSLIGLTEAWEVAEEIRKLKK